MHCTRLYMNFISFVRWRHGRWGNTAACHCRWKTVCSGDPRSTLARPGRRRDAASKDRKQRNCRRRAVLAVGSWRR